ARQGVDPPPGEQRTIDEVAQYLASATRGVDSGGGPVTGFYVQTVYFVTDRQRSDARAPDDYFAGTRAALGEVTYGIAEVNIPRVHKIGDLNEPSVFTRRTQRRDPRQYIFVEKLAELDRTAFSNDIEGKLALANSAKEILVYIHGFNNSFDYAVRRGAQI